MSTKFSPGPWKWGSNNVGAARLLDADNVPVVSADPIGDSPGAHVYVNDDANARLIAAAPEMYELLRAFCYGAWTTARTNAGDRGRALLARIDGEGWALPVRIDDD